MTDTSNLPAAEDIAADVPSSLTLAGDFPRPTDAEWEDAVLKVLNRGRPEGKELSVEQAMKRLTTTTVDGIAIDPLYTREDAEAELGYPGVAPFTRGTTVKNGDMDAWDVRALHEDPDVSLTKRAVVTDLERGATSVWLRVDSDAIKIDDLDEVLEGVLLDLAKIDISSREDQVAAAEALLKAFEARGGDKENLSLNLGLDPIGNAALNGGNVDLGGLAEWVKKLDGFKNSKPFVVDATVYHNAGAGDVTEIGWAIATGIEYARALIDQGVSPDDAFGAIIFRVSATTDQFATIARLRALRTLWNRVGEELGVSDAKRGARQHAVQSWREITRDDPYVNILRGTISTFGAAVGGAEAITTLPLDTAWGLPSDASRRIARNTQIVLAEESNIGRVNDPAGGSWYVEQLTNALEQAAWGEVQAVEAAGGMAAALKDGRVASELEKVNAERAKRLATRKKPLTGVSEFPNATEAPVNARTRPAAPAYGGLAWHRDAEVFEKLRDATKAASTGETTPSVFLACLGTRRDFGAREGFTANLFHVAGLATPQSEGGSPDEVVEAFKASGAKVAVLCSNAKVYASQGLEVAKALKDAGAAQVLLAGNTKELGESAAEAEGVIDGTVFAGMDVVELLTNTLKTLGVSA